LQWISKREGELVGIDIDNTSKKLDLKELFSNHIPAQVHIVPV
jgi:hypothetical protein